MTRAASLRAVAARVRHVRLVRHEWNSGKGFAVQAGMRAAGAAEELFPRLQTEGVGFDVELLLRACARGWRVREVAVNSADQRGSKVACCGRS
jgi:glycosyltransferase involved in cell wall biosynthesis